MIGSGGTGILAGMCGVVSAAGVLMVVAGLRRSPMTAVTAARPAWKGRRSRLRSRLGAVAGHRRLLAAAAGTGLVVWVVTGWVVAGAAAGLAVIGARRLRAGVAGARQLARLEALEAWTRRLADLLGSGAGGLEQAIGASVRTCPPPVAVEVGALAGRLRVVGPEVALRGFADDLADIGSPAADLVAAALILRVRRGGHGLRPVLDALAADVADLVRARRAIDADRAKPRSNVRILLAVTGIVLGVTMAFARDYLAPFGTPAGQVMLAVITGVFAAAVLLLARITRLPDTPRFLPAGPSTPDTASPSPSPSAAAFRGRGSWWG